MKMNFNLPKPEDFSTIIDGKEVRLFCLENPDFKVFITNYGVRIAGIFTKDKHGKFTDVIIGPDTMEGFLNCSEKFYGATVGRCCNRILNAEFEIDGEKYKVTENKGKHHLHGGNDGFHNRVWKIEDFSENHVTFSYLSKHLEEGYPGNLLTKINYSISEQNELIVKIEAETDQKTIINITTHPFFNLNGSGSILNHHLWINSEKFTPVNEDVVTTGEIWTLDQTAFDFREEKRIGERIENPEKQLILGKGYDHNFVLNKDESFSLAAIAKGDISGIVMKVFTEEKGMQLYTGNWMNGENNIKNGLKDEKRTAFCLETQNFPNAANFPHFPKILYSPDEKYSTRTVYQFLTSN